MYPLITPSQMAESDAYTIQVLRVPGDQLMENAAQALFEELVVRLEPGDNVAVVIGSGNNGGDGLALTRILLREGYHPVPLLAFPDKTFSGDAALNWDRLQAMKVTPGDAVTGLDATQPYSWIVDAVFGTGLSRPLEGRAAEIIALINQHPAKVLAVDLPSGLNGADGRIPGPHIQADVSVTFEAPKPAHAITPASQSCGQVVVKEINVSLDPSLGTPPAWLLAQDYQRPARAATSHKGSFGSLAVLGGFSGMEGAANLAAVAALRYGVGKVRVLTDAGTARFHHDSVMVGHPDGSYGRFDALVVGPGLSREADAFDALDRFDFSQTPVVWDADGLYYLKQNRPDDVGLRPVMTPHPGEAAMLLDISTAEVQQDRLSALRRLSDLWPRFTVVLKGHQTLMMRPDGRWYVCQPGNAALAVAGSGDVLAGMIGALLAQGYPADQAAYTACLRHGMAAEHWIQHHDEHAMTAEDIIADLKRKC